MLLCALLLAAAPIKLGVLDVNAKAGFDAEQRDVVVEFLQSELRARGFSVIGKSDIEALLGFQKMKESLSCDTSCLAEIGGALGVNELVVGQMGKVGNDVTLTLKRVDPKAMRVSLQIVRTISSERRMIDELPAIVDELFPGSRIKQSIRFVVSDTKEAYPVAAVDLAGNHYQCPAPVTLSSPCDLQIPAGNVRLIVRGYFESKIDIPVGVSVYRVKYRSKKPAIALGITGSLATIGGIVMGVHVSGSTALTAIAWTIAAVGIAELVVGLPLAIIFGGNVSRFEERDIVTRTSFALTPVFTERGVSGAMSSFGFRF